MSGCRGTEPSRPVALALGPWGGRARLPEPAGGRQLIDRQMSPRPGAGAADPPGPPSPEPAP